ncbi:MATE family efflux transporter [Criibacterium bergeronii]|uniref:MATE family efflux transporter n=1 Tax=Criibacterium bergeronii TaxID=1871336 RepID=A0A552VDY1_9FIRM|nr:MATE family efflux transporter [Criibacterium bergeronii]TRW28686.1 MATE family efflux transporter [Criibacterium bergeronii]
MSDLKENKMGTAPMKGLLISVSSPIMVSMLVQALYNMVDSLFVSRISENALTAVSICFPIQQLMIALTVGLGVGVSSLVSRYLGKKDLPYAKRIANTAIFAYFLIGLFYIISGIFFTNSFVDMQNIASTIKPDAKAYMRWVTICSLPLCYTICFERLLASTGRTFYTMITQGSGALANIILDPIFIFTFGLGVQGAAIATVLGQLIGALTGLYFHIKKNHELKIDFSLLKFDTTIIKEVLEIGFPSMVMQSVSSFTLFVFNTILSAFSGTAVAFFGVFFKLQSFVVLPIIGLSNGLLPVAAYNFGAKNKQRVHDALKYALIYSLSFMSIGLFLFLMFPVQILNVFNASPKMIEIGVPALRIIPISLIFATVSIILSSMFQALGSGVPSLIISLIRQVILLMPLAYYFSLSGRINRVWYSFLISEIIAFLISIFLAKTIFKKADLD